MEIVTLADRPDLSESMWELGSVWPVFMKQDLIADVYYAEVEDRWSRYALLGVVDGSVVARAFCVPFAMGGDTDRTEVPPAGWDGVIRWAYLDVLAARPPTTLAGLEVAIAPTHRGTGVAERMLEAMVSVARAEALDRVVIPVRPSRKHQHVEMSMGDYLEVLGDDGLPEDPWLRTHVLMGGIIAGVCPVSMTIVGTPAQWREWTGLPFAASGSVVVPGALAPVRVDLAADAAVYVEPNVWVVHRVDAP